MSKAMRCPACVIGSFAVLSVVTSLSVAGGADGPRAKLLPPEGKTLVAIGSSWGKNVEAYAKATGHKPQGLKFFAGLNTQGDVDYFRHQVGQVKAVPGGFLAASFNFDPVFPRAPSPPSPEKIRPYWNGDRDAVIEAMGRAIKDFGGPVFADLGGEFDINHRGTPQDFVRAFRHVHEVWDRLGVTNVLYVWHSGCQGGDQSAYHPGDRYVDVIAFSAYERDGMALGARLVRDFRRPGQAAAIFESGLSPKSRGDASWRGYYGPLFELAESLDAALLCYNNFGDDYGRFFPRDDPFRDTQMDRMPREVRQGWGRMMKAARYRSDGPDDPRKPVHAGDRPLTGGVLLNGKDFTGWTGFFKGGDAQVEDEFSITGTGVLALRGLHEGYLRTETPDQDFVLTLDWRFPRGGRQTGSGSGVLLGLGGEDGWLSQGFEVQVASRNCGDLWVYGGIRFEGQTTDGRFGRVPKKLGAEKPIGEWNTYEIRCEGMKIVVNLNGKVVNEGTSDRTITGRIGLISQGTEVEFREIRVRSVAPGR